MSSQIDGPPATADAPETRMPWGLKTLFRLVSSIERVGNKLPHPFLLFWLLAAVLAVVSAILAALGTGVVLPSTGEVSMVRKKCHLALVLSGLLCGIISIFLSIVEISNAMKK